MFSAKNILLIIGSKVSFADYLSLVVLVEVLTHQGISVDMANINQIPNNFNQQVAFPNLKKVDKMPARKFVLSFDKGTDSIKNIQWQQTDQKVSIHISTEKGQFKAEGMNVSVEGANYDAILYFKVKEFAEVEKFFSDFPNAVYEVKNISLGDKFAINNAKVEILESESSANLPETVYSLIKTQTTTSEQHTKLLAAIISATNHFRTNVSKSQTFTRCAELLNSGANLEQANSLASRGDTPSQGTAPNPANASKPIVKQPNPEVNNAQVKPAPTKPETATQVNNTKV